MLVEQWQNLGSKLPSGWSSAELQLELEHPDDALAAASFLAPAQPFRPEPTVLRFRVSRDGSTPGPTGIQRLLRRIDEQRIHAKLSIASTTEAARSEPLRGASLVESWQAQLAALPADWTDLFAEIELTSTDYLERCSLLCVPLNLRRDGTRAALRFRAASRFGYGASTTMVHRCLERCDAEGIRGEVTVLRVLSGSRPVGTQGPVWLLAGRTI